MKKLFVICISTITILLVTPQFSFAQPTPSQSDLQEEQAMQDAGQKIYQNLQDKKITCQQLTGDDFEKLGEFFMGQSAGSTQNHVYWDQRIQSMMGESGDTQMHTVWGERESGCFTNLPLPSGTPSFMSSMMSNQTGSRGGVFSMMGWGGYGYGNMMYGNFSWGFGIVHVAIAMIVVIDLILAGIWLWQQIRSHKRK